MTEAQKNEKANQIIAFAKYERRAFRKKCVTQGIVTFRREDGSSYYIMSYRNLVVTLLWGTDDEELILLAVWNTIAIAEQLLKAEQFVRGLKESKHESK